MDDSQSETENCALVGEATNTDNNELVGEATNTDNNEFEMHTSETVELNDKHREIWQVFLDFDIERKGLSSEDYLENLRATGLDTIQLMYCTQRFLAQRIKQISELVKEGVVTDGYLPSLQQMLRMLFVVEGRLRKVENAVPDDLFFLK